MRANLKLFLLPTIFCDSGHPEIMAKQKIICRGKENPIDRALLIRKWIEENIAYRFDFSNILASETQEKGSGQCINRANLQIALSRAAGIPAGYGVVSITKRVFQKITPPKFYEMIGEPTLHIFCVIYDEKFEKWRYFDATVHKALYRVYKKKGMDLRRYTSDGESKYKEEYLVSEISIQANIDHFLAIPHRWLTQEYLDLANNFLRDLEKEPKI